MRETFKHQARTMWRGGCEEKLWREGRKTGESDQGRRLWRETFKHRAITTWRGTDEGDCHSGEHQARTMQRGDCGGKLRREGDGGRRLGSTRLFVSWCPNHFHMAQVNAQRNFQHNTQQAGRLIATGGRCRTEEGGKRRVERRKRRW
jgi:hypothetical protein